MQKPKADEDGVTIIAPDFSLKKAIGPKVDLRELFSEEVVEQAQQNVVSRQETFLQWFSEDLAALERACAALEGDAAQMQEQVNHLHLAAISIKSRAGTFGYELASEIARSLYVFLDDFSFSKGQCNVIRKHIDALKVILQQRISGSGGNVGAELLRDIKRLAAKFKKPI